MIGLMTLPIMLLEDHEQNMRNSIRSIRGASMPVTNTALRPRSFKPITATAQCFITGAHTFLYRLSGAVTGERLVGCPVLLLTTTGRKSGKARTIPILYLADRRRFVLVASKGGTAKHPLWYLKLLANPQAQVQVSVSEVVCDCRGGKCRRAKTPPIGHRDVYQLCRLPKADTLRDILDHSPSR